jgi:hypothetical protein
MLYTVEALIRGKTMLSLESWKHSIFYYDAAVKAAPRDPEVLVVAGTFFAHLSAGMRNGVASAGLASKWRDDGATPRAATIAEPRLS